MLACLMQAFHSKVSCKGVQFTVTWQSCITMLEKDYNHVIVHKALPDAYVKCRTYRNYLVHEHHPDWGSATCGCFCPLQWLPVNLTWKWMIYIVLYHHHCIRPQDIPQVNRLIRNRWVPWLDIKWASLKGSVVHKQGWGEVHHFVNNCVSK